MAVRVHKPWTGSIRRIKRKHTVAPAVTENVIFAVSRNLLADESGVTVTVFRFGTVFHA